MTFRKKLCTDCLEVLREYEAKKQKQRRLRIKKVGNIKIKK